MNALLWTLLVFFSLEVVVGIKAMFSPSTPETTIEELISVGLCAIFSIWVAVVLFSA